MPRHPRFPRFPLSYSLLSVLVVAVGCSDEHAMPLASHGGESVNETVAITVANSALAITTGRTYRRVAFGLA